MLFPKHFNLVSHYDNEPFGDGKEREGLPVITYEVNIICGCLRKDCSCRLNFFAESFTAPPISVSNGGGIDWLRGTAMRAARKEGWTFRGVRLQKAICPECSKNNH